MTPGNLLFAIFGAVAGLLLGGVVNWLADTFPQRFIPQAPKYLDGALRPRKAWSGLLAFLTGARKSAGGAKLSWRYPLVEIGMIALYVYIALAFPVSIRSVIWMINIVFLMLITVIDLEHRLILYVVIVPACVVALVGSAIVGVVPFQDYLIGGAVGFGLFFIFFLGGVLFISVMASARGEAVDEVAFGFGDVLLATLSGFMLGWQALIFAILLTVFLGAFGAIMYLVVQWIGRGKYVMFTALPYGQYIVIGTLIMLIWREPVRIMLQGR